jgi:hypothetical protein
VVKVVVQLKKSFQYVRSENEWTDDAFMARNFERIHAAFEFCRKHQLRQAYIICGELNPDSKQFNAATKSIWDIAHLR